MGRMLFEGGAGGAADVAVCVSLYNYRAYIAEALESVRGQTLGKVELVVVDDCSRDDSAAVAAEWMGANAARFTRTALLQPESNAGLSRARNLAAQSARAEFLFVLDADNGLYPRCLERCLAALKGSDACMAHTIIECFGDSRKILGAEAWAPERFLPGNYVDAMAMIRRKNLLEVGGYAVMGTGGWEDYDLWCRFIERGWRGIHVPEILGRYRIHAGSMLDALSNPNEAALRREMARRHPWLRL